MTDTAVWFDLEGTLVEYERDFDRMVADALVAAGARSPPDDAYEAFAELIFNALEDCDPDPYELAFEGTIARLGLDVDASEAADAYREIDLEATTVSDAARETLAAVEERAPVGLLANGDGDLQRATLERNDLAQYFDEVVIANEVGVRKPDPEIFELAAERLDAERHVYVGDEFETDVRPAEAAGWDAVHVRNDGGPAVSVDGVENFRAFLL